MISHYDKLWYVEEWVITRLQSGNWDQEVAEEDAEEIGNSDIVETIIDPVIPTTITLNTNCWGTTDLLAQIMGEFADVDTTNPYSEDASKRNDWIVNSSDMNVQACDLVCRVRDDRSGLLERTVWFPNCYIQSINWNYDVNGMGAENFTLRGDTDRHFLGKYLDAHCNIGTYASGTTFTVPTDEDSATYTELYMSVNDVIYDATTYISGWATYTVTVTGVTLVATDRIRLFFYKTTPDTTFTELNTSDMGAIKGSFVVIGLGDADVVTSATKTLRIQSVDVNVTITREDLKELGTTEFIGKPMKKQEITIDAVVLEEDMENYARMLGASAAEWTNRAANGLELRLQNSIGNSQDLFVKVYDDQNQGNLLKTLEVTGLRLTRSPFTLDVGGTGQYTLSLKGSVWSWTGGGTIGRLANAGVFPNLWQGTSTSSSTTTT